MTDMEFENQVRAIAAGMEYPRTPDVAGHVITRLRSSAHPRLFSRKLAWSLTIVLILISSLALIPPVRAAIIDFIQIGVVHIFPRSTEPTSEIIYTATPFAITPDASLIPLLEDIAGKTTLVKAQQLVDYPILLPTYPIELGQPDNVYVQDADGAITILVWIDPSNSKDVLMSLHFIPSGSWAINKFAPVVIEKTLVNGQRAVWAVGPYPLKARNGDFEITRMIDGHVLIWTEGDVTCRLETNLSMDEAVTIAESLEPIP